ncbi:MAG: chromosome segregation ATPase [Gammaproteobacteria bacterium]|jgi:chromosome segregation ATPase
MTDLDQKASLENVRLSLVSELDQLQHELRRVKDGIESTSGLSQDLEEQAEQLADNINVCERELAESEGQMDLLDEPDLKQPEN